MRNMFLPPRIKSLAEIDTAEPNYETDYVMIEGIVFPTGGGGWFGSDGQYFIRHFDFAAWRFMGKPLVRQELVLMRPVPLRDEHRGEYAEFTTHRVKVLLSNDHTRAVVAASSPIKPDSKMLSLIQKLKKPVILETEGFGKLIFNRQINRFEGAADWNGQEISISFRTGESQSIERGLKTAARLWTEQSRWKRRIETYAVKKLLRLKNSNWLNEDETPLTSAAFKERMTLESITVSNDGDFTFWHHDGDLFAGHAIEVRGNIERGLFDGGICG
jgi:hypothetical protein